MIPRRFFLAASLLSSALCGCDGIAPQDAGAPVDSGTELPCDKASAEVAHAVIGSLFEVHVGVDDFALRRTSIKMRQPADDAMLDWELEPLSLPQAVVYCAKQNDSTIVYDESMVPMTVSANLVDAQEFDDAIESGDPFEPDVDEVFATTAPMTYDNGNRAVLFYSDYRSIESVIRRVATFSFDDDAWVFQELTVSF